MLKLNISQFDSIWDTYKLIDLAQFNTPVSVRTCGELKPEIITYQKRIEREVLYPTDNINIILHLKARQNHLRRYPTENLHCLLVWRMPCHLDEIESEVRRQHCWLGKTQRRFLKKNAFSRGKGIRRSISSFPRKRSCYLSPFFTTTIYIFKKSHRVAALFIYGWFPMEKRRSQGTNE